MFRIEIFVIQNLEQRVRISLKIRTYCPIFKATFGPNKRRTTVISVNDVLYQRASRCAYPDVFIKI